MLLFVDLFCGAGGTTIGVERAKVFGRKAAKVIAAVNHDPKAIKSHAYNHRKVMHFVEDIRTLDLRQLKLLVDYQRQKYPNAALAIWASLECINFSKAKGGMPREADSRTLGEHLPRYIDFLKPDYVFIENVTEFMSWGPLDDNGKPISKLEGVDYLKWRNSIESMGFRYDHRILNSADYGAYTKRVRYFAQFAKGDLPIQWPAATHAKNASGGMFGSLEKWKPVKDVLNFNDEGTSIFARKKDLSEKTMGRVLAGLIKYVAGGDTSFITKWNSNNAKTGVNPGAGINEPCPVVTTQNRLGLVQTSFLQQRNSGDPNSKICSIEEPARTLTSTGGNLEIVNANFLLASNGGVPSAKVFSTEEPCRVITASDNKSLVSIKKTEFIAKYYGSGGQLSSVDEPSGTLTTKDRMSIVKPKWIDRQFSSGGRDSSIEEPMGSLLTVPKSNLVTAEPWLMNTNFNNVGNSINEPAPTIVASRRHYYLMNPQWNSKTAQSVDDPCFTLIARMDKAPPSLITTESGQMAIVINEKDSETVRKIKFFMAEYGIVDIKMRMLKVPELLRIQGFPKGYYLAGTQADQKRFIGNSVETHVAQSIAATSSMAFLNYQQLKQAA